MIQEEVKKPIKINIAESIKQIAPKPPTFQFVFYGAEQVFFGEEPVVYKIT